METDLSNKEVGEPSFINYKLTNNQYFFNIMPRPHRCFCKAISFNPNTFCFKPQGIPMKELQTVELSLEEVEAYRLRHIEDLDQQQAANKIKTSTSTYQRILYSAYKKIADALINGKAIKIVRHE